MRPRGDPLCRGPFPLLAPKQSTDGSSEGRRSKEPGPQTASEGSTERSKPHRSTLRIFRHTGRHLQLPERRSGGRQERLCPYLQVFLDTLQERHPGSQLLQLGLELEQHRFALGTLKTHAQFYRPGREPRGGGGGGQSPDLCSSSPGESASGRNSWFSSGPLFQ